MSECIQDLSRAILLDPRSESYLYNRGLAHYDIGLTLEVSCCPSSCLFSFHCIPGASRSQTKGKYATARDEFQAAIADYTAALAASPSPTFRSLFNRGMCHRHMGSIDAALEDFQRAVAADPTSALIPRIASCTPCAIAAFERATREKVLRTSTGSECRGASWLWMVRLLHVRPQRGGRLQ